MNRCVALISRHSACWRGAVFVAVFTALQLGWEALRGTLFEYVLIHDLTIQPAAFLINQFTPDIHAQAMQFNLQARGGGLNIRNGCEGLEVLFLLWTAFAVAPLQWRSRLLGLLIGMFVVFVVNQLRILVLFYAYRLNHAWFDPLHASITPIVVVLLVTAYFYTWLFIAKQHADAA